MINKHTAYSTKSNLSLGFQTTPFRDLLFRIFYVLVLFTFAIKGVDANTPDNLLNEADREYLKKLGPVTMCIDPDWKPYEYLNENQQFSGISADLINLISGRTGIEFKLIKTTNWDESLQRSKQGDCMILTFLNQTIERDKWLLFTDKFFTDYNVFITREEHEFIPNPAALSGKTIALPRGTSIEERVRRDYPNLEIILFDSEAEAIKAVNDRIADMTLRSLTMAAYIIKTEGWFNLKIAGHLPDYTNKLKIGVSKEYPLLRDILNKAISTLTEQDIQNAVNNHVSIKIVAGTDYTLLIRIGVALLIVLLVGLIWNYQLRRLNRKLASSEKELMNLSEKLKKDIEARKKIEAILKSRDRQMLNLISNLPGFVYQCLNDDNYTMEFISDGCFNITGYHPRDFVKNRHLAFSDVILPEDLPVIKEKWEIALNKREHFEHEYRIINADKTIRWVWERGYCVFDNDDKLTALEGFITDITARKLAEEKLAYQNSFYKLISEISADFINANPENIDAKINKSLADSGIFLDVDRTYLCQLSNDESLISNTHEWCQQGIISVKDTVQNYRVNDVPMIAEIIKNRELLFVPDVDNLPEGSDKEELKTQQVKSFLCLPIIKGSLLLGYFGFDSVNCRRNITEIEIGLLQVMANILGDALLRNIIELKNRTVEADLRESEGKYRLLTENTADVIWVLDLNAGKFSYISPSVFHLRGVTATEAMNETIEDSLTPESVLIVKEAIAENVRKFISNPEKSEHYINELQQFCKNGQAIWIEVSTQFRFSPSGSIEILGVTRNIEERKKSEAEIIEKNNELQKLINEKDKFFSIIAHDLKSPFNSILGFSELLKDEGRDLDIDSIIQYAGIINSSAQHTFELLENLLEWARMQQGRIPFEPKPILLKNIINAEYEGSKETAYQKNISLIDGIHENIIVTADENMVRTVIRNLISNAIKFTPKQGFVKVSAEVRDDYVHILVSDSGVGIKAETIGKLFKIETSFTTRGTENEKGTGLGLLLCKEFIEKHGGKIWVESEEGKGSTFSIALPVR